MQQAFTRTVPGACPRSRLPVQPRTLPMSKVGIFIIERSQPPAAAVDILPVAGAA